MIYITPSEIPRKDSWWKELGKLLNAAMDVFFFQINSGLYPVGFSGVTSKGISEGLPKGMSKKFLSAISGITNKSICCNIPLEIRWGIFEQIYEGTLDRMSE